VYDFRARVMCPYGMKRGPVVSSTSVIILCNLSRAALNGSPPMPTHLELVT
jgi:hypothetical protein